MAVDRINQQLLKAGHQPVVLVRGESNVIVRVGCDDGVPVFEGKLRFFYWRARPLISFVSFLVFFPWTLLQVRRFVRQQGIDIVAVHFPDPSSIHFLALSRFFGTPYTVSLHGSDVHRNLVEHWSTRIGIGATISGACCVIACSQNLLDAALKKLRRPPKRSRVINIGLDPSWRSIPPRNPESPPYIVGQGLPIDVKGGDLLVTAFTKIAYDFPDVHLVVIGSGDGEEKLRQQVNVLAKDIRQRIQVRGTVPRSLLPGVLQKSTFGVISSRREGLPLLALELQALGRPVVAFDVGGLSEAIIDTKTGYLVAAGDTDALADRMRALLKDEKLREQMGTQGRAWILERFQIQDTVNQYVDVFERTRAMRSTEV